MKKSQGLIGGLLLGAGLMYLLDPDRGTRRRALARDRITHARRQVSEGVGSTLRDVRNRSRGMVAKARSRFDRDDADDVVIEERVRAALGRAVAHPAAVEAAVHEGVVTLRGAVLETELDRLLDQLSEVPGVDEVVNELTVHATADTVPQLQGGRQRGSRPDLLHRTWSPAVRLGIGALGAAAVARGLKSRGPLGAALSLVGMGVLARAVGKRSRGPAARAEHPATGVDRLVELNEPASAPANPPVNPPVEERRANVTVDRLRLGDTEPTTSTSDGAG